MKRGTKITLWIVGVIALILIVIYTFANSMLSRFATREVNKLLADIPNVEASCGDIHISILTGNATIEDLQFSYRGAPIGNKGQCPGADIFIDEMEVDLGPITYASLTDSLAYVHAFEITHPRVEIWMDEEHPELSFPSFEQDSLLSDTTKKMSIPFNRYELKKLYLEDACLAYHSLRTSLDIEVDSLSICLQKLAYDSVFTYNDSLYSLSLARAAVRLPDGRSRIYTHKVDLQALGVLSIGSTRFVNTTEKTLANNEPGADIRIPHIEIGPLSHSRLFDGEALVKNIKITRPRVELWMDEEHPELSFPGMPKRDSDKPLIYPFNKAKLQHFILKDASLALHSTRTKLDVLADSCSLALHHLAYDGKKGSCDTTYTFSLKRSAVEFPDGRMGFHVRNISRREDGIFSIGEAYIDNTTLAAKRGKIPGADIRVENVEIGPLSYKRLAEREVVFEALRINRPQVELWMDEEHPELSFPKIEKRQPSKRASKLKSKVPEGEPLVKLVALNHLEVNNVSFKLHSLSSKLDVVADSCSVAVNNLAYDNKNFTYSDSVYSFSLASAKIMFPDGRMKMETRTIAHQNCGEVKIGATRIANTMPKKQLADIVQEPVTWIDLRLESVRLSPLNPIQMALKKNLSIDHIDAVVGFMDVFRDERYKPKRTFPMPQRVMMDMPITFFVRHTDAEVKKINIDFASTNTNIGHLELGRIHTTIDQITNRRGYTMSARATAPVDKGQAKAAFEMSMNQDCNFLMRMHATNVNTSFLNGFIRPLVGMTSNCVIDTIDTQYAGNSVVADGTFRMLYHGFSMEVHKGDDIPYQIITKNADTFNHIGNSLIPKSNPKHKHSKPYAYQITWRRNEKKPVELYLFGPLIDGVKKTFLPGLYVHLRTKDNQVTPIEDL